MPNWQPWWDSFLIYVVFSIGTRISGRKGNPVAPQAGLGFLPRILTPPSLRKEREGQVGLHSSGPPGLTYPFKFVNELL